MSGPRPPVALAELEARTQGLEARLFLHPDEAVHEAYELYQALLPRLAAELGGQARDLAIGRLGALMLVQALARARTGY